MPPSVPTLRAPRAADASMDLLNQIVRNPYDPDYAVVSARGKQTSRGHWMLVVTTVLIGALFAIGALQTTRRAPSLAGERSDLIARIQQGEATQDELRRRAAALNTDIGALRTAVAGGDDVAASRQAGIERLEPIVGAVAVSGPGITVTVDDGPEADGNRSARVHDTDLQILANGLWESGAEAVAINGHRLSALTAIRGAGEAITVDYRSLTRPYVVQAVGDSRTLQARFIESGAGVWWNELAANQRVRFELAVAERLDLDADAGLRLRYADRGA
jgi:uncharacterized protein YlxW (UPF0749 family)